LDTPVPGKVDLTHADIFRFHFNVQERGNVHSMKVS